jgi:hypothetical protein
MCSIDWSAIANWISALATAVTAVFAWMAITSWRAQLRGASKHAASQEIAVAAGMLKYAFYDARSPMILVWEFPKWPHIFALAKLRPLAGAVLGDPVASAVESLARKARELHFVQEQAVKQKRDGAAIVAQYGDQNFVKRVRDSLEAVKGSDDPFSLEFEAEMAKLQTLLSPHMR